MDDLLERTTTELEPYRRSISVGRRRRPEPDDPSTSWFGRVTLAGDEESWPEMNGRPMAGLLQIVVDELPFVPKSLEDTRTLTLFLPIDADGEIALPNQQAPVENGTGWAVRVYGQGDTIVPIETPLSAPIDGFALRWDPRDDDHPSYEDLAAKLPPGMKMTGSEYRRHLGDAFPLYDGTKVGGWPACISGPAQKGSSFVLQIGAEEDAGFEWGDDGLAFVARDREDVWWLEWQSF